MGENFSIRLRPLRPGSAPWLMWMMMWPRTDPNSLEKHTAKVVPGHQIGETQKADV